MSDIKLSPQQHDFVEWAATGTGSCVLEAVAGAGKTFTLIQAISRMQPGIAVLAYNRKIADEISSKLQRAGIDWRHAEAGTVHSFGFRALKKAWSLDSRRAIDEKKVEKIVDRIVPADSVCAEHTRTIVQLVSHAKNRAMGVVPGCRIESDEAWLDIIAHHDMDTEETLPVLDVVRKAREALRISIEDRTTVDFDDMIYMPLVHRVRFWQYRVVMVDEAQDTNAARRAMVRAMLQKGGRVIAVGDRHQAIYGFTGADADSLDLIRRDFAARSMPLTTTYRCPKAVVQFARQWVSHITAHESAPEGRVSSVSFESFLERSDLDAQAAVLCRKTAPLVELALSLIRRGVACRVEGRDVAAGLKKLATRWKVKTLDALELRLEQYLEKETTKLLSQGAEQRLVVVEDTVETLRVLISACRLAQQHSPADLLRRLDDLFGDDVRGMLVLSTIHKSKGREWPRVFWLDRANTCPSRWARQQWQMEQEDNLCYVAATRAQEELVDVVCPAPVR